MRRTGLVTSHSLGDPSFSRSATSHLDDPLFTAVPVPHGQLAVIDRGSTSDTEISTIHHQNIMWYHMYVTPLSYPLVCTCSRFQNNWTWSNIYPDTAMILSCYPTISHEVLQSFAAKCHSTLKQLVLLGRQRWVILPSEPWGITSSAQLEGPGGKKKKAKGKDTQTQARK